MNTPIVYVCLSPRIDGTSISTPAINMNLLAERWTKFPKLNLDLIIEFIKVRFYSDLHNSVRTESLGQQITVSFSL